MMTRSNLLKVLLDLHKMVNETDHAFSAANVVAREALIREGVIKNGS